MFFKQWIYCFLITAPPTGTINTLWKTTHSLLSKNKEKDRVEKQGVEQGKENCWSKKWSGVANTTKTWIHLLISTAAPCIRTFAMQSNIFPFKALKKICYSQQIWLSLFLSRQVCFNCIWYSHRQRKIFDCNLNYKIWWYTFISKCWWG